MEPILSNVAASYRNEPRDLQSRLYREIGISAVAAALEIHGVAQPSPSEKHEREARRAA